ncbi:hypothetical protein F4811DRAFT_499595 [Daldinia bambusicola]|nr:hypothetical protein F4811DRAFT_499595 [Daldinia bambusicola]
MYVSFFFLSLIFLFLATLGGLTFHGHRIKLLLRCKKPPVLVSSILYILYCERWGLEAYVAVNPLPFLISEILRIHMAWHDQLFSCRSAGYKIYWRLLTCIHAFISIKMKDNRSFVTKNPDLPDTQISRCQLYQLSKRI